MNSQECDCLSSNINDNNVPTLIIKNKTEFFKVLTEYINIVLTNRQIPKFITDVNKNNIKFIISYLFANATTTDFENPIQLITKHINFNVDNTFEYLNEGQNIKLNENLLGSTINIKNTKQSLFMETPFKIETNLINFIDNKEVYYQLPTISYGINKENDELVCYIYNIQNPKDNTNSSEQQNKYTKKIKRELYKLNANVLETETQEFLKYKQAISNYYPENISDISVSTLISLTAFIKLLENNNISKIKIVPYLPIRYLARDLSFQNLDDASLKKNRENRNNYIQQNITDKFIRTFRRIAYHLNGVEITSYPYELSEFLEIKLNEIVINNNQILSEIYNNSNLSKNIKKY